MRWLLLVAACAPAYTAGTIPHATALPCLDVAARAVAEGSHVELTWAFGNRCDHAATVALGAIHVEAFDADGRSLTLEPREQPPVPLPLGAGDHGVETFRYDADADIASLAVELGSIEADTPSEHRITIKPEPRPPQNDEELATTKKKPKLGAWAMHDASVTDAVELGTLVVAAVPDAPVITHADGTRAQVGTSSRLVGIGLVGRALRSPTQYLTLGVEILPGAVLGPRDGTIAVDNTATTVKASGLGHALFLAGLHTTGDLQIGVELALGVSSLTPSYGVPADDTVAPTGVFRLAAEARVQVRWWVTRAITVTLGGGRSAEGDLDAAVGIGVHFLPYDGR